MRSLFLIECGNDLSFRAERRITRENLRLTIKKAYKPSENAWRNTLWYFKSVFRSIMRLMGCQACVLTSYLPPYPASTFGAAKLNFCVRNDVGVRRSPRRIIFTHEKSERLIRSPFLIECGNDLSSRQVTLQVLSARQSLTSVFGMRTGGPLRYHHHNGYIICILYTGYIRLFSVEHWQLHRSVYHNLFLFRTFGLFFVWVSSFYLRYFVLFLSILFSE